MTEKKYITTVGYANKNTNTLRSVIPLNIVNELELKPTDKICWIIDENKNISIKKLDF